MITLTGEVFDPAERLRRFGVQVGAAGGEVGAIVSFTGLCRDEAGLDALELEAYHGFAETEIAREAHATNGRFGVVALEIVHRVGRVAPGEAIVFVAAAARHRRAAFQAVDQLMDYLKSRAPFWKKEIAASGERWIEPRAQDYEDAARWDAPAAQEARG